MTRQSGPRLHWPTRVACRAKLKAIACCAGWLRGTVEAPSIRRAHAWACGFRPGSFDPPASLTAGAGGAVGFSNILWGVRLRFGGKTRFGQRPCDKMDKIDKTSKLLKTLGFP